MAEVNSLYTRHRIWYAGRSSHQR